jgi:hypothetical protein
MLATVVLTLIVAQTTPVGKPPVGVYRVESTDLKGKNLHPDLPVGQLRWLEVHPNKTWILRDFMSAFKGTWKLVDKKLKLTVLATPSGRSKRKDDLMLLLPMKGNDYRLPIPKNTKEELRFYFDPKFLPWLRKEYDGAVRNPPPSPQGAR